MVRQGAGWAAIGIGLFMGLGILMNLGGGFGVVAYALALLFCCAFPIGVGLALLRPRPPRALGAETASAWGAELIRLAARRGGALTVAEVAAHTDLAPAAAEEHLDRLCADGLAEHCVSESGVIVYRFEGLLSRAAKRRASSVLDD